ncbi:MAG: hypothetical protein ACRENO_03765 [Thermodesulfobacteriota bacterium]
MRIKFNIVALFSILFLFTGCNADAEKDVLNQKEFKNYWYSGKAEITSYDLKQARYGEIHDGYAVTVFVTEPFSKSKQVKLDNPGQNKDDVNQVLKLNYIKKFNTGVYEYSIMDSIFTPVNLKENSSSVKISSSVQEWCGNVYTQLNLDNENYIVESFSYFESEGDTKFEIKKEFLEDEIWNRIRINPSSLPTGKFKLIPSVLIARLTHRPLKIETVTATLSEVLEEKNTMRYKVIFPDSDRELSINFSASFPYEIESWEEKYKSGFGPGAKVLTTTAVKKERMLLDYWNKHDLEDIHLRKELGIE